MYKETREDLEVELIVGKSKDGPTGTVKVGWLPEAVTFRSKAKITEPPQVMAGGRQWEGN
jgi:replicative DNA helicase